MIGCTILLAVSGILLTQAGRSSSGLGTQPAAPARSLLRCLADEHRRHLRHCPWPPCVAGRGAARAGPVRPGRRRASRALSTVTAPGPLVRPGSVQPGPGDAGPGGQEPFTHCRSWSVRSAVLSHHPLACVGGCPLAIVLGLSAGLLVGVSGCRPVSPLSFSPIVQWGGFGPARRRMDRQQHSKVVSAPACWILSLALSAGLECCVHRIASSARPRRPRVQARDSPGLARLASHLAKDSSERAWAYSCWLRADSGLWAVPVGPTAGSAPFHA
jgi:hypothetical protein